MLQVQYSGLAYFFVTTNDGALNYTELKSMWH